MILLDSDVIIEIFDRKSEKGRTLFEKLKELGETVVTSAINLEEVLFGIYKKMGITSLPKEHSLMKFPALPFTSEDASTAARLEIELENQGKKKPRGDVLIAAIAINNNCKLMTGNKAHFVDINGLELVE